MSCVAERAPKTPVTVGTINQSTPLVQTVVSKTEFTDVNAAVILVVLVWNVAVEAPVRSAKPSSNGRQDVKVIAVVQQHNALVLVWAAENDGIQLLHADNDDHVILQDVLESLNVLQVIAANGEAGLPD